MDLLSLLKRLRTRPPRGTAIELTPSEQVALAHLIRKASATLAELEAVVDARNPIFRPEPGEVAAALVQQGAAEARIDLHAGTIYVPTSNALKLKKRIPEEPRTVTQFWV